MSFVAEDNSLWIPETEEEKELVRRQMNRLLETSHFKNSRRYPALFKFIVEESLDGRGEFLKERLLGVHVFDRPADYDTATDPIVRVTIAEIRKRIAQYYHEDAHQAEMRIELLPGHYAPEFRPRHEVVAVAPAPEASTQNHAVPDSKTASLVSVAAAVGDGPMRRISVAWRWVAGVAAVLMIAAGGGVVWRALHPNALSEFWQPVLANRKPLVFCLPTANSTIPGDTPFKADGSLKEIFPYNNPSDQAEKSFLIHESLGENVVFSDVMATVGISNLFATQNHDARYRLSTVLTLYDLRQGPAVLIGGLDNQWTLRALNGLRYKFFGDTSRNFWIIDTKDPQNKGWELKLDTPLTAVQHDYAIIARVHDEDTGQIEVVVAGIGMSGTAAAGELLVNPQQIEALRQQVGPGFRDRDFEAVLETDVVSGIAGEAKIEAVWVR